MMQPYSSCALPIFAAHLYGACKNRSAAPAVPSLLRPLDALAAAAPHGDSNPGDLLMVVKGTRCNLIPLTGTVTRLAILPVFNFFGCNLIPLALSRFLRRTCMVLAKTGALRQPCLRCFVHWTRSARLPLTGTEKHPLGL